MTSDTSSKPPQNLILIGFMGCGKSTIGQQLQNDLGYQQIDTDHFIESKTGRSIPEIFASEGEQAFRDMETRCIKELLDASPRCKIISTGGGLPLRPENRQLLNRLGYVVWLDASADAIFERVSRNQNRPLLQTENPRQKINEMLTQRRPIYEEAAHIRIKTDGLSLSEIAFGVTESARVFFSSLKCG